MAGTNREFKKLVKTGKLVETNPGCWKMRTSQPQPKPMPVPKNEKCPPALLHEQVKGLQPAQDNSKPFEPLSTALQQAVSIELSVPENSAYSKRFLASLQESAKAVPSIRSTMRQLEKIDVNVLGSKLPEATAKIGCVRDILFLINRYPEAVKASSGDAQQLLTAIYNSRKTLERLASAGGTTVTYGKVRLANTEALQSCKKDGTDKLALTAMTALHNLRFARRQLGMDQQ